MCFFFTVGLALRTALNGSVSVFRLGPTAEACRSMLQHTENWVGTFGGKISDQNINSIPVQSFVRDRQYSSGQTVHL